MQKKNTVLLVVLFTFNILLISALNTALAFFVLRHFQTAVLHYLLPKIFGVSCLFFIAASTFFIFRAPKGTALAETMGGKLIQFPILDPLEKRLFNIVEEMSIAAGVAIPFVYVLANEKSINSFAAGTDTKNIVIAVTRGSLEALTREELQAMIAHEFSHILNEDMQLNVQIAGVVSGFQVIMHIGKSFLNSSTRSNHFYLEGNRRKSRGHSALFGLLIMLIGAIGFFLGRMIQSLISKQREFLADASSAQFTRNPVALAIALAKISALGGSGITTANSIEYAHIFFAEAFSGFFSEAFSTHPKIIERVQRLVPGKNFSTLIEEVSTKFKNSEFYSDFVEEKAELAKSYTKSLVKTVQEISNPKEDLQRILSSVGAPTALSLDLSQNSLLSLQAYRDLIQDSEVAKMALLMSCVYQQSNKEQLFSNIKTERSDYSTAYEVIKKLIDQDPKIRVLVFNLALGVLRTLPQDEKDQIILYLEKLFLLDHKTNFLESALVFLVKRVLADRKVQKKSQNLTLVQAQESIRNVIFWSISNGERMDSFSADTQLKLKQRFQKSIALLNLDSKFESLPELNFALSEKCFLEAGSIVRAKKEILIKCLHSILIESEILSNRNHQEEFRLTCLVLNIPIPLS